MLITIGAFDGFHKGHAELLRLCRENADGDNWGVISFEPHPAEYMHKLSRTLFTLRERELIRLVMAVPNMYFLSFTEALKNLAPYEFWQMVRERFCVDGLVMGSDFHFGLNRAGNAEYLSRLANHDGLSKIVIAEVVDKAEYSSSKVREMVEAGNVERAHEILGYPFFMLCGVKHGFGRGRKMSFPTANIDIAGRKFVHPAEGVYACAVIVDGRILAGAASLGNNPTFGDVGDVRCEVHIPGYKGELYGHELPVFFLGRVRSMRKFASQEELAAQINMDIEACDKVFASQSKDPVLKEFSALYEARDLTSEVIRLV